MRVLKMYFERGVFLEETQMSTLCYYRIYFLLMLLLFCLPVSLPAQEAASPPEISQAVKTLLIKSNQARDRYEWQDALTLLNQALIKARASGDKAGESVALNNTGIIYSRIGQPQKALEYYEKSLPLRREVRDREGEATTLK